MDAFPSPALPLVDRVLAVAERMFPERAFEAFEEDETVELFAVVRATEQGGGQGEMSVAEVALLGFEAEPDDELLFLVARVKDGEATAQLEDPSLRVALKMDAQLAAFIAELNELSPS